MKQERIAFERKSPYYITQDGSHGNSNIILFDWQDVPDNALAQLDDLLEDENYDAVRNLLRDNDVPYVWITDENVIVYRRIGDSI